MRIFPISANPLALQQRRRSNKVIHLESPQSTKFILLLLCRTF
jgi:hypothetical protein